MVIGVQEMESQHVARWGQVEPYGEAFLENRLPGRQKNLYKIINKGVLENYGVVPAIPGDHRFGVSLIEVPAGGGAGLHSHLTEEVFFILQGELTLIWGDTGEEQLKLGKWDCVSVPTNLMRGFRNEGSETVLIYSVVGGRDAEVGKVTYGDDVREQAAETGLALDDTGHIVEIDPARKIEAPTVQ